MIGPRFRVSKRRQADRFAINPISVVLTLSESAWLREEYWRRHRLGLPKTIPDDYSPALPEISVDAHVDLGSYKSSAPRNLLARLGYRFEDTRPHDVPIDIECEGARMEGFSVEPRRDVDQLILGWVFVLSVLMPGLHQGVPDWHRAESNVPEPWGPILSMLAGVSQTYAEVRGSRDRAVLILGQDSTELHKLRAIQLWLYKRGFDPILVRDLPDIREQTVEEKVELLATMCRFVVCEDSTPSGHIDELAILRATRITTALVRQQGRGGTWMQADYPADFRFMRSFTYTDTVTECLEEVTAWASEATEHRSKTLARLYPWRRM
jgi:hypothetical protein